MIGNAHLDQLVASAPTNFSAAKMDWDGYREAMQVEGIDPSGVVAASWCVYGTRNIEAQIDPSGLGIVHPSGVLVSAGKRKMLGKAVKCWTIPFSPCRAVAPAETTDERGFGKYCIEFAGAGNILLGRLEWNWSAKRFRDSRPQIMAVAEERDRVLAIVAGLIG